MENALRARLAKRLTVWFSSHSYRTSSQEARPAEGALNRLQNPISDGRGGVQLRAVRLSRGLCQIYFEILGGEVILGGVVASLASDLRSAIRYCPVPRYFLRASKTLTHRADKQRNSWFVE